MTALLEAHPLAKVLPSIRGEGPPRGGVDVLHAMLEHRTPSQPGHEQAA